MLPQDIKSLKEEKMFTLDVSLDNEKLYNGCKIEMVGGRKTLVDPIDFAVNMVGTNCYKLIMELDKEDKDEVVLTGPMAVWAYLVVFHIVVHKFNKVYYDDGRNDKVLISKH